MKKYIATAVAVSAIGVQVMRPAIMDTSQGDISAIKSSPTLVLPVDINYASYPKVSLGEITGASSKEIEMVKKATDYDNQVLQSECAKKAVMNASFTERNIGDTKAQLSNPEIWDLLVKHPITFKVNIFTGSWWQNHISKTMGYDIGDGVVYMNRYYVDDAKTIGSLILHEAEGHGQGFHHYGVMATSIPYKWNDFFDLCVGMK